MDAKKRCVKQIITNISQTDKKESHLSGSILGGQTTRREGEHLMNRQLFSWHKVKGEKGEYYALLVLGKRFNKQQIRTYKLTLPSQITKYRCAICTNADCKECPYQGVTPGQRYEVLDSVMLLCKAYRSALEKCIWDVAAVLADEIIDIISSIDLPEPEESRSAMNPGIFLGMRLHYEWVTGKERTGDKDGTDKTGQNDKSGRAEDDHHTPERGDSEDDG